jgi:outer membrane lipoprotein-sorting protein
MMKKRFTVVFAVCFLFLGFSSGCTKKEAAAPAPQAQPAAAMQQAASLSGKVVETMNSGGYTYVNLENNGQKTWVAMPETPVKVGQQVQCRPGMEMRNFTSKTLKRTFESIYFSGGLM